MHDGQHMLPGELIAILAVLLAPPLLLAFVTQTVLLAKHRFFRRGFVGRAIAMYISTFLGSLVIGAAMHQFTPRTLGSLLRVREVAVGSQSWPVMPLAFFSVAIAAVVCTWRVLGRDHTEA